MARIVAEASCGPMVRLLSVVTIDECAVTCHRDQCFPLGLCEVQACPCATHGSHRDV